MNPCRGRPQASSRGILYVVATPIGNLEDITFRALRILKEADVIACEDTRRTRKILDKFNFQAKLLSYYQPKEKQRIPHILSILKEGRNVALVTDSGCPGISDPGFLLVREAVKENIPIIPVPGASALLSALSVSGLPTHRFLFIGFPPKKKAALERLFEELKKEEATLAFYLPPRRLFIFLESAAKVLGNRQVVIAREMTKIHEEFIRGNISDVLSHTEKKTFKGEITLLIHGAD